MKAEKGSSERPRIEITPESSLADEGLQIRLAGFKPRQRLTLSASLMDDGGKVWESHAVFTCDTEGELDLPRAKPSSGTYRGADAMGLFWSMSPRDAHSFYLHRGHEERGSGG